MDKLKTWIKISSLVIMSSVVLALHDIKIQTALFFVVLAAILFTKERKRILGRVLTIVPVGITIIILQLIFNPAPSVVTRITFSLQVFLRLLNISLLVFHFVSTTSPKDLVSAFSFMSQEMRLMMTMTFYFIPLIFEESGKIMAVQKSRGLKSFRFNMFPLVVPLLHRVFARAQALSLSIVSRGYDH
jgi:energy-coupling factor transporter transmembrane protein EcfT